MEFKGASAFKQEGDGDLGFHTDYLKTSGKKMQTASSFRGTLARNVYSGIDFHTYVDGDKPRYDFVVRPQADASQIHLAFKGTSGTQISGNAIAMKTQIGTLSQGKLYAYQTVGGRKQQVAANFVSLGKNEYGFKLGSYDHSKQLVIDPLVYGTYYGGDGGFDEVRSVTTDNAGGVYMCGYTMAPDFPAIYGPYGFTIKGGRDAFVSKLQGDAFNHDYAALIGGSLDDYAQFIKIDPFGDIWVAGRTQSSDFPGNEIYQRANVQFITATSFFPDFPPTGGGFSLQYGGLLLGPFKYNITAAQLQASLNGTFPRRFRFG